MSGGAGEEKWTAEFEEFGGYDSMSSTFVIRDEAGERVAVLDTADYTEEGKDWDERYRRDTEMERRANLIAKAPELARQVEELRVALMTMLDQIDGDPLAHQFFDPRLVAQVKAVIAKTARPGGAGL